MSIRQFTQIGIGAALVLSLIIANDAWPQKGRGNSGGSGNRSAGHQAASAPRQANSGPAMSRPQAKPGEGQQGGGNRPGGAAQPGKKVGDAQRPDVPKSPPAGGKGPDKFQRPGDQSSGPKPTADRPSAGHVPNRPGDTTRPSGGATSAQLNDFLGKSEPNRPGPDINRPGADGKDRPDIEKKTDHPDVGKNRPEIGKEDRPKVGDRRPDVKVGDVNVNVDKSIDYSKNQKAWIDNRHATGNQVRVNAENRYSSAYRSPNFRGGVVGGYPYYGGWGKRGTYYGWTATSYVAFGAFMGGTWANSQPVYYAYGAGGNVYYEQNTVYVNGQPSGTAEQYAQQLQALIAAIPQPAQVGNVEWLPLGAYAYTREDVGDSQGMIELAVNKQGVLAGTYNNEATGISRPLKGMLDQESQRAAVAFADGKNADLILETGINNLTQDECPALLHFGASQSSPVLLVRLQPPAEPAGAQ
jgi:hypothetical protein